MSFKAQGIDAEIIHFNADGAGTQLEPKTPIHADKTAHQLLEGIKALLPIALSEGKLAVDTASSDTLLTAVRDRLVEIGQNTDTLESLIGKLDNVSTLLTTANNTQAAIVGLVDQLEGYVDGIENTQATQLTRLEEVRDRLPSALIRDRFKTNVSSVSRKWREDFAGAALDPSAWKIMGAGIGAGQSITVNNSTLSIAAGTTANSETIIRSVEKFSISFRTCFIANLSQRIVNQEFYLEIVDASGGHYASWLLDGTNTLIGKVVCANNGNSLSSVLLATTNTNNYQIFEIESFPDEINFFTRTADSSTARASSSNTRSRQIPDPNLEYFVQIRVKNLGTAPASSTLLSIDAVTVQDIEELTTEVTGGRGGINANQAIPTAVTNAVVISGTVTAQDNIVSTAEFVIPLAANALGIGTNKDTLTVRNTIRGWVFTDVSGTLLVEHSTDNTTWRQTDSFAITGNATQATRFEFKFLTRYYRFRYQNGGVAQTVFQVVSTAFNIGA